MAAEDELSPFKYSQNSSPGRFPFFLFQKTKREKKKVEKKKIKTIQKKRRTKRITKE